MIYQIVRFVIQYRHALLALLLVLAVFGAGFYIKSIMAENKALEAQVDTLQDTVLELGDAVRRCAEDKVLTEEVGNEYQRKIRALNKQLNDLKWLRDNA